MKMDNSQGKTGGAIKVIDSMDNNRGYRKQLKPPPICKDNKAPYLHLHLRLDRGLASHQLLHGVGLRVQLRQHARPRDGRRLHGLALPLAVVLQRAEQLLHAGRSGRGRVTGGSASGHVTGGSASGRVTSGSARVASGSARVGR